jgi:chaperonin GroEL (HSP60 family)
MIAQVGTISANTDKQVGSIIAKAMKNLLPLLEQTAKRASGC